MKLNGVTELLKDMKAFGPTVSKKAADVGVRKAAAMLRREFKKAAPKRSGTLRKAIKLKYSRRSGKAWVGLRERYYYKTLEMQSERGAPLHPFFEKTWNRHKNTAADMIVSETRKALYTEAGKVMARSRMRRKR